MEDDLLRRPLSVNEDTPAVSLAEEEFAAQETTYGHVSASGDDEDYDDQEWSGGALEKCNLIVNYLPHEIDDVTLKTLFIEHGDIAISKVVKDKLSKKSLGYGFVKFVREEDAASAIECKNGFLMGHKKLKVSLARPPSTEIRNCKLYITNLPKEFTEREVLDLFSQFGEIIECRVLKDRNSKSNKGVAFVQFGLRVQANNALSLNGYRPPHCDRHLMVKYAEDQHKKKDRRGLSIGNSSGMNAMEGTGIMMGNGKLDPRDPFYYSRSRVPTNMYRSQQPAPMQNMMNSNNSGMNYQNTSPPGYPSSRNGGKSMTSSMPSLSNGTSIDWYGQMPQMAYNSPMGKVHPQSYSQQSMSYDQHMLGLGQPQQRHNTQIQNQNPTQGPVYTRSPGFEEDASYSPGITIIISFLPQHADVALLHDLCAPYGRIINAQIDMDNISPEDNSRGGCSGRGRVQMASHSQAQYATQALNGAIIFEGGRPLQVSIAFTRSMADTKKPTAGGR